MDEEELLLIARTVIEKETDVYKKLYYLSTLKTIDVLRKELNRLYDELIESLELDTKNEETH